MVATPRINAYADVGTFQRLQLGNAGGALSANHKIEILRLLLAVSRSVDEKTNRYFYSQPKTRYFNGSGTRTFDLNEDLVSCSLAEVSYNGTDFTALTGDGLSDTTDFYVISPDEDDPFAGPPWLMLRTNWETGSVTVWPRGFRRVRITGVWGYRADTVPLQDANGVAITGTLSGTTSTALTLSAIPSPAVTPGATLVLGAEQVFVTGGADAALIVQRAVNKTTAAAHASVTANLAAYPDVVTQAVVMQTARLWARKDTPLFPHFILQGPGTGTERLSQGLDPDINEMLRSVRRYRDLV